jgi:rhodanese-related sulfurtransferase
VAPQASADKEPVMFGLLTPAPTRTPPEVEDLLNSGAAVLVDVREPGEHAQAAIPGATLVPLSKFTTADLPPREGKELILHCKSGMRSADALARCRKAGLADVSHMAGGIMAWHSAGLPVR